ncbi:MAG: rod shape-determining protein MreD [Sporomusaceae bacterium]|nr:rod shape-determining protein MreD [Sporomusaceae bacterium]
MKILRWIMVIMLGFVIQCALLPIITINGVKPDLLMIMTLATGLLLGKEKGVAVGFFTGLTADLASGGLFGCHVLAKMLIGYGAGMLERQVFKEHFLLPLMAVIVATFVHNIFYIFMVLLLGFSFELVPFIVYNFLPLLAYNVLAAIPVHLLIYKLNLEELQRAD